jgi:hypothetical protein
MKDKIGNYVFGPLRKDGATLFPDRAVRAVSFEILKIYIFGWAAAGCLGVFLGYALTYYSGISYFYDAGVEASAPKVWNMVVMFGLGVIILASLAGIFGPNKISKFLFSGAYVLMKFASECGGLAIGVITGLLLLAIFNSDYTNIVHYIYAGLGLLYLTVLVGMNCIIWWVTYCLRKDVSTPEYFTYIADKKLLLIGLCLFLLSVLFLSTATIKDYPVEDKCTEFSEPSLR